MKWVELDIWEQVLVADDGEIVGSIVKNKFTKLIESRPIGKRYIDRESARKAVERSIKVNDN